MAGRRSQNHTSHIHTFSHSLPWCKPSKRLTSGRFIAHVHRSGLARRRTLTLAFVIVNSVLKPIERSIAILHTIEGMFRASVILHTSYDLNVAGHTSWRKWGPRPAARAISRAVRRLVTNASRLNSCSRYSFHVIICNALLQFGHGLYHIFQKYPQAVQMYLHR